MKMQMKLSPQQMMLMRLLQMPAMVLEQAIQQEVEKNPLLEVEPSDDEEYAAAESLDHQVQEADNDPLADDEAQDFFAHDDVDDGFGYQGYRPDDYSADWSADTSMVDGLMDQLLMKDLSEREMTIVTQLVGSLDDAGYLSRELALIENELAFRQDIECRDGEMDHALQVLQSLEPAGVGARDLRECLMLQLKRVRPQTFESRCAWAVLDQCFDQLGQHNYAAIMDKLEIDEDALEGALDAIRKLNPKPCGGESAELAPTVVPDFVVSVKDGHLSCQLNRSHSPRLRVSSHYVKMMEQMSSNVHLSAQEEATLSFLKERSESAQEFIDNVDLRQQGLLAAMSYVAKLQRKYFVTGDTADLKPLTQKELAEMTGIDETVMSRIVNEKYVQTDFGTILMKDLFVHASGSNADGEEITAAVVQKQLQELVAHEDKRNPLTDDQLVEALKAKGYTLARRTVAKYRGVLDIPVARLRKVLKVWIMITLMAAGTAMAQGPGSYYDSLIYSQQHPQVAAKAKEAKNAKDARAKVQKHPGAKVDTALLRGDDLIDKTYDADRPMPSSMWYGARFSSSHVRLVNYSMDSLPDEVNLRLVRSDDEFCFPVKNIITSPYGWRWERPHRGVDVRLNVGDPVHSAFAGVVRIAKPMGAYGNLVVVRHFNGLETVYGHLSKIKVHPMQEVKAGDVIGLGGSTGRSTGPHLHFEVRFQYEPFDPEWILDFSTYKLRTKKLHLDKTYFGISKPKGRQVLAYKADKSFVKEEPEAKIKPKELYYTVKKGDKMAEIASRYKTTIDKIVALNPEFERLRPGLKLRVR